ncbi:hypothetical protein KSP39_PZI023720 [Platanthera zijinensis]|uniref:Uncharacterized protein n=1 Tax=Platanthera zijinensis TaxID=2320716 RepID=A0AAP0FTR8_9ASPA
MKVVVEAVDNNELVDCREETLNMDGGDEDPQTPQVSVHLLTGITHYNTIRVTMSHQCHPINVLIDLGSAHNFLDEEATRRLQCCLVPIAPFSVVVANRKTISSSHKVEDFKWLMQRAVFTSDMLILPLGGCIGNTMVDDIGIGELGLLQPTNGVYKQWEENYSLRIKAGNVPWGKEKRVHKLLAKEG